MIDWRKVPWPLWAYCAITLLGALSIDTRVSGPAVALVLVPILTVVWLFYLLRGVRWLWFATLAIYVLIIPEIVSGSVTWEGVVSTVVGLVLLLLPATRRYFAKSVDEAVA